MDVKGTLINIVQDRKMKLRKCNHIILSEPVYTKLNYEINGTFLTENKVTRLLGMDIIVLDLDDETLLVG